MQPYFNDPPTIEQATPGPFACKSWGKVNLQVYVVNYHCDMSFLSPEEDHYRADEATGSSNLVEGDDA